MEHDRQRELYAAFKAKDSRFDGRLFVGITSTGIYCRPVCRARMPKQENCVFFHAAAQAEKQGFRPCLLCRPELAPGLSAVDAQAALAHRAARYLQENCGEGLSLPALAARLGYTDRHLRRAFQQEFQVSPVEYLQTCRLLLAKGLLTDTQLPVTQVALAAGFGSLRRFHALFAQKYRLSPMRLRAQTRGEDGKDAEMTVALGYRPPYAWDRVLRFLAARAIHGVECVSDGQYARTMCLPDRQGRPAVGWVRVGHQPEKARLRVTLSAGLLPVLPQALGRLRNLFDLSCDPDTISEALAGLETLVPGAFSPGLRVPGCADAFELCVRAVLGQQITVKAAGTLAGKLAAAFGTPVSTGIPGLTHVFPAPQAILALPGAIEDHLGPLGIIASRARAIRALAELFADGAVDFALSTDPEADMDTLMQLPGIGPWTASYIAMRALGWPDAFVHSDLGIRKALGGMAPKQVLALSAQWRPWRSYAAMALWDSLDGGTKLTE